MIFMLDNYDSFTYNLVQYLSELGAEVVVRRNDAVTVEEVGAMHPSAIVISPGPCTPREAGISVPLLQRYASTIPTLGVCLGHQSIGAALGGDVVRAPRIMHGKTSPIHHDGGGVFAGMSNPFEATRYHSLVIKRGSFNVPGFAVTAWTAEGEIMGVRHEAWPLHGVQFHPESFLTTEGPTLLRNFLGVKA